MRSFGAARFIVLRCRNTVEPYFAAGNLKRVAIDDAGLTIQDMPKMKTQCASAAKTEQGSRNNDQLRNYHRSSPRLLWDDWRIIGGFETYLPWTRS